MVTGVLIFVFVSTICRNYSVHYRCICVGITADRYVNKVVTNVLVCVAFTSIVLFAQLSIQLDFVYHECDPDKGEFLPVRLLGLW